MANPGIDFAAAAKCVSAVSALSSISTAVCLFTSHPLIGLLSLAGAVLSAAGASAFFVVDVFGKAASGMASGVTKDSTIMLYIASILPVGSGIRRKFVETLPPSLQNYIRALDAQKAAREKPSAEPVKVVDFKPPKK